MANNFSKNDKGINIEPSTVAGTAAGDLRIDSAASNVPKFHDGSSEDVLVRRTATETLTNKTIVVASNTVTTAATGNLAAVELNAALAELQSDIDGREPTITTLSIAQGGTNSGTALNNNRVMQSSGSAIVEAAAITASRALVSDANGIPVHATTTAAEIGYVNGVTSAIQTQLDAKAPIASPSFTGDITLDGQASTPSTPSSGYYKAYVKDSTGKLTILNSAGTETAVGGGSGGINLIGDGADAEAGTTGWSTFADAASSRPADGTGGSANVTWTTSSTAPLYGVNSFVFTKDASNRQGEGVAWAFTVSPAHQAKVLQVSFDYIIGSGTFVAGSSGVDSDLIAYIYDVTNSTPIELSSFKLLSNSTTIADRFNATFQTSATGTSYRLILYCATTSASAYTVKFDNISVSPSTYVYGTPITDWQSYTPVITSNSGTLTNYTATGMWKQNGDSADYKVNIEFTGSPGTWGGPKVTLKSGHVIDTAKLPDAGQFGTSLGSLSIYDSGTRVFSGTTIYMNTTEVLGYSADPTSGDGSLSNTSPMTFASGDVIGYSFSVPILGWSSSVQTSDQTDTRVVAASVHVATPTSTFNGTSQAITMSATATIDTHGGWNGSTTYTCKVSGKYRVKLSLPYFSTGSYSHVRMYINQNGTGVLQNLTTVQTSSYATLLIDGILDLVTDDTITFAQVAPSSASFYTTEDTLNFFDIERISGPSAIAASESINARYSTNAGQSIPDSTTTIVNFEDKSFDSHGSVTTGASWKYTAPISGIYRVSSKILFTSTTTWTDGESVTLQLFRSGSAYSVLDYKDNYPAVGVYAGAGGSDTIRLNAGEYFDIRMYQTSGGTLSLHPSTEHNYCSIERIGN